MPPSQYTGKDPVSTHSRLKAAGALDKPMHPSLLVSTHSRLKAAGKSVNLLPP